MDTDPDGKVRTAEYLAYYERRFKSMGSHGQSTREEVQTGSMENRAATKEKAREKLKKRRGVTTE